ncbi:hypothetical protein ACGFIR_16180 [Micromonospora sp. NPDC049051]|uniref:hypothetical protein n=1 Tax=unclassified Micromonospora TaxID=2617518 RepID=UPI00371DBCD9
MTAGEGDATRGSDGDGATEEALRARSAREVFDDHLRLAAEHRFAEDLARNVSPSCVVLERRGVFRGHAGVRELARWLEDELPGARYEYTNRMVEDRMAFLEWTAQIEGVRVRDGADSFLIEQGWIVAQTIHYTLERAGAPADPPAGR